MSEWRNLHEWMRLLPRLGEGWDFGRIDALDLGCGPYSSDIARQLLEIPFKSLMSVDLFRPNVEAHAKLDFAAKGHVSLIADVRDFVLQQADKSFDFVFCFDCLEHLPKDDGQKLLAEMERVARLKVVIMVPREPEGFHRANFRPENAAEEHLSHWREQDLYARGFLTETCADVHDEKLPDGGRVTFSAIWAIKDL